MSACMSGTRGSGVLSSTGDVLVRGVVDFSILASTCRYSTLDIL